MGKWSTVETFKINPTSILPLSSLVSTMFYPLCKDKSFQTRLWICSFSILLRKPTTSILMYYHVVSNLKKEYHVLKLYLSWKLFQLVGRTHLFWLKHVYHSSTSNPNTILKKLSNKCVIARVQCIVHKYHFKLCHISCYKLFGKFDVIKLSENNYCIYNLINNSLCVKLYITATNKVCILVSFFGVTCNSSGNAITALEIILSGRKGLSIEARKAYPAFWLCQSLTVPS